MILCQNRSVLGGNASSEIRMHVVGADISGGRGGIAGELECRESGLIEEIRVRQAVENPARSPHSLDLVLYEMVRDEDSITLLLDTHVTGVEVNDGEIKMVRAERPSCEEVFEIRALQYLDCSGDSRMATEAGNPYRVGREAKSEFNEMHAVEEADHCVLGSTVLFQARDMGRPVPFRAPAWARKFTEEDLAKRPHSPKLTGKEENRGFEYGFWWIEWGGELDTIRDNGAIHRELLSIVYGIWDHLKNGGQHGAENWALIWVGMLPGKRESRRMIGRYVLTEQDVVAAADCCDAIAYGGWPIDLHPPRGVDAPEEEPCVHITVPHLYPIPLRCCVSPSIANLWFAGRNLSATHVAFASTRVMATCAVVGQGLGIAAALAAKTKSTNDAILASPAHLTSIQQEILRQDGFLIGVPNVDPGDLARQSVVTASDWQDDGAPANVIDGYTRSTHGPGGSRPGAMPPGTHRWISRTLPAWLRLDWESGREISEVQIIFDTGLHRPLTLTQSDVVHSRNHWGPQPETVRHYRLTLHTAGQSLVFEEKDNYLRRRVHHFPAQLVRGLTLDVFASHGAPEARICEIRCYGPAAKNS